MDNNITGLGGNGLVRVQSNAQLIASEKAVEEATQLARDAQNELAVTSLSSHVRSAWERNRDHKETSGVNAEMLGAIEQRDGTYDSMKLAAIQAMGGTDVFISLTNVKCRAAEAWLSDVMNTAGKKPWALRPSVIPELPPIVEQSIVDRAMAEFQRSVSEEGRNQLNPADIFQVASTLRDRAEKMLNYEAERRAHKMETQIEDQMSEGKWDQVFDDVLTDIITLKAGIIKSPVIRYKKKIKWVKKKTMGGKIFNIENTIILDSERVSPFNFYPSPGQVEIDDGDTCEIMPLTRKSIAAMKGNPGYDDDAIDLVLKDYSNGLLDHWTSVDESRAAIEKAGDRSKRQNNLIQAIDYWGSVQGQTLIDRGLDQTPEGELLEPLGEYEVNAILIGNYIIYSTFNHDPLGRRPYSKSVYAKIPGSFWGKGVPELMKDLQQICNAAVRSMVNNLGWSSGPQVAIDDINRLPPGENVEELFPAKVWQFINPMMSQRDPIKFFNIESNAQELMAVYEKFAQMADDFTGIPAYSYGNDTSSNSSRTASGLSMLMTSAARGIKKVIGTIDREILKPVVLRHFEWNMLFNPDEDIKGDVSVVAEGVLGMIMKEQMAAQRMQFLQATMNPLDSQIMGIPRRANVLRKIAESLDMNEDDVVPPEHELSELERLMKKVAAQQQQEQQGKAAA